MHNGKNWKCEIHCTVVGFFMNSITWVLYCWNVHGHCLSMFKFMYTKCSTSLQSRKEKCLITPHILFCIAPFTADSSISHATNDGARFWVHLDFYVLKIVFVFYCTTDFSMCIPKKRRRTTSLYFSCKNKRNSRLPNVCFTFLTHNFLYWQQHHHWRSTVENRRTSFENNSAILQTTWRVLPYEYIGNKTLKESKTKIANFANCFWS
jgi:hypothetical protein